jgi:hypothetical protein
MALPSIMMVIEVIKYDSVNNELQINRRSLRDMLRISIDTVTGR